MNLALTTTFGHLNKQELTSMFGILREYEPRYAEKLEHSLHSYADELIKNKAFHPEMPDSVKNTLKKGTSIPTVPYQPVHKRFLSALVSGNPLINFFLKPSKETRRLKSLDNNMSIVEGFVDKMRGLKAKKISGEQLKNSLFKIFSAGIDPNKGKYKASQLTSLSRLVQGAITSVYFVFDTYNAAMGLTSDPKISGKEAKKRVKQEIARVLVISWLIGVTQETFRKQTNASPLFAAGVLIGTLAACEIGTRILLGKPFYPVAVKKNKQDKQNKQVKPSFGSNLSRMRYLRREKLNEVMGVIREIVPKEAGYISEKLNVINKSTPAKAPDLVPIGIREKWHSKLIRGILSPVYMLAKPFKKKPGTETQDLRHIANKIMFINKKLAQLKAKYKNSGVSDAQARKSIIQELSNDYYNSILISLSPEKQVKYNASIFAIFNRQICMIMATIFFTIDAYNMALKHKEGDEKQAKKEGKKVIASQTTRLLSKSYIMNIIHDLSVGIFNASLLGAGVITASITLLFESLSRFVLGEPILPKTKAQLDQVEEKKKNSKSPFIKLVRKFEN